MSTNMDIQEKLENYEREINCFEQMLSGTDRLVTNSSRPWKWAVMALVLTVAICVCGWVMSNNRNMQTIERHMDTIDKLTDQIIAMEQSKLIE